VAGVLNDGDVDTFEVYPLCEESFDDLLSSSEKMGLFPKISPHELVLACASSNGFLFFFWF
jgi:hypothetical protein